MTETDPPYALTARTDLPFAEADRRVRQALQDEGFGVLTEIDVAGTLKKNLDVDLPRYTILDACAPPLAYQALQREPAVGLLLPCNVVVREETPGGPTVVQALDPVAQLGVSDNDALIPVAGEAHAMMRRVMARVRDGGVTPR